MADALQAALRLMSSRPRSESEVNVRLSRRFSQAQVQDAIATLKAQGLLDDRSFATSWRNSREQHKPRGASGLRWELHRLGVAREVVDEALEGLDEEAGAYQAASKIAFKLDPSDQPAFKKRLVAHLRRRGFRFDAIEGAVQRTWEELTDPVNSHIEGIPND